MSTVEKSIRLYAWKTNYQTFQVVQGESDSRTFNIQLFSTTIPVNLTACEVMFFAIKPDSTKVYVECEVVDAENGLARVTLTEQMCVVDGTVDCWVQVIGDGGADLRFEGMNIEVSPCPMTASIMSTDDMRAFLQMGAKLAAVETEVSNARAGKESLGAGLDANKKEVSAAVASLQQNLNTQKSRIDAIAFLPEGSTRGDAELADLRIPAEGFTVPEGANAGTAVRAQFSALKEDIDNKISVGNYLESIRMSEVPFEFNCKNGLIVIQNTKKNQALYSSDPIKIPIGSYVFNIKSNKPISPLDVKLTVYNSDMKFIENWRGDYYDDNMTRSGILHINTDGYVSFAFNTCLGMVIDGIYEVYLCRTNFETTKKYIINSDVDVNPSKIKYSSIDVINEYVIENYEVVIDKDIVLHDLNLTKANIKCVNGAKINTNNRPFATIKCGTRLTYSDLTPEYITFTNSDILLGDYIFIQADDVLYHNDRGSGYLQYGEILQITKIVNSNYYFDKNITLPNNNIKVFKLNDNNVNIDVDFKDIYTSENSTEEEREILTISMCINAKVKAKVRRFNGAFVISKNCVNSKFEADVTYGESGDNLHLSYALCDKGSTACRYMFNVGTIRHPFTCRASYGKSNANVISGTCKGITTCTVDDHEFAELNVYKDIIVSNRNSNEYHESTSYITIYNRSSEIVRDCELEALQNIYINECNCKETKVINCRFYSDKLSSSNIVNRVNAKVEFINCIFDVPVNVFENPCVFVNCMFNGNVNDTVGSIFVNCTNKKNELIS